MLAPHGVGPAASSFWAQGGIAAAVEEGDTPEMHADDTIRAGARHRRCGEWRSAWRKRRARASKTCSLSACRSIAAKTGLLPPSREAAHSHRRIVRVKGDGAGRAIMEALSPRSRHAPPRSASSKAMRRASASSRRAGASIGVMRATPRRAKPRSFPAAALVLATGGVGHLYRVTTNPPEARGEGVAMAARAGALIADAEFVQFHPTAIDIGAIPRRSRRKPCAAKARCIIDSHGRRFMLDADPAAELAPRDIVARGVFAHRARRRRFSRCARRRWAQAFPSAFPTVYASCMAAGVDPARAADPDRAGRALSHGRRRGPTRRGRTAVPGLWAAGEVASTGVHGANRLASNSLLEAVVFGARIAEDIAGASPARPPRRADASGDDCASAA